MKYRFVLSIIIVSALVLASFSACSHDNGKIVDPYGETSSGISVEGNSSDYA